MIPAAGRLVTSASAPASWRGANGGVREPHPPRGWERRRNDGEAPARDPDPLRRLPRSNRLALAFLPREPEDATSEIEVLPPLHSVSSIRGVTPTVFAICRMRGWTSIA